jgi:secreted PhoX family phosphatase
MSLCRYLHAQTAVHSGSRSDIWEASLTTNALGYSTSVKLFATNTASGSEATGIYFKPSDVSTLYVNVQHPTSTNDLTMAISKI